ncbi:hypothetical protein C8Q76DRAFT_266028 [Earliella scabrosa]|nr:hypothetical protein C8Q76DRAFT_266028 [Earliella scabrosa]
MAHEGQDFRWIAQCIKLRSLTVTPKQMVTIPIPAEVLRKLALLPHLEAIRLSLIDSYAQRAIPGDDTGRSPLLMELNLPPGAFPSLRHLSTKSCPASHVADILRVTSSMQLTSVSIPFLMGLLVNDPHIPRAIAQLCSPPFSETLQEVDLHMRYPGTHDQNPHTLCRLMDVAPQLLNLRLVERLVVDFVEAEVCISDEDMEQMGAAWPHLVELSITYERQCTMRITCEVRPDLLSRLGTETIAGVHPSIRAVVAFALQCKQLNALTIDVADFTESDLNVLEERSALVEPQRSLVQLIPRSSCRRYTSFSLPNVDRAARVLHGMFPALRGSYLLSVPGNTSSRAMELHEEDSGMALHKLMCALDQVHPPHARAERQMASPAVYPREPALTPAVHT